MRSPSVGCSQEMVLADPEQARQLLAANPQLAFALMEAMALLKMVHPSTVHVCTRSTSAPPSLLQPCLC